ncbi:MAG: Lrp/AsnC family transcriptional regulator [Victivallaceae bacterium]|nr:Lrp/AsnC family transcriptional regulator [Victivallaceae bacterium]
MEKKIIELLREDARLDAAAIAEKIGADARKVAAAIKKMEKNGVIRGYTVIANEKRPENVKALIEVRVAPNREGGFDRVAKRIAKYPEVTEVELVSGGYDLLLTVEGESLQEVASFVSAKLATIDGVISTATSFLLKKYKESGRIMQSDEDYERLKICM